MPEPPSFLKGYAAEEWRRVAPELHRLGLLTNLDVAAFGVYCQSYSRWRTAEECLGEVDVDGGPRPNALVKIAAHAARDMLRYAQEFGMTPAARARIAAGVWREPPPGKFDGLLGG